MSDEDIDKVLPLYQKLWQALIEQIFRDSPKDFPALERKFLSAYEHMSEGNLIKKAFKHVAIMTFYSLDAVPTQTEHDYLRVTAPSPKASKP